MKKIYNISLAVLLCAVVSTEGALDIANFGEIGGSWITTDFPAAVNTQTWTSVDGKVEVELILTGINGVIDGGTGRLHIDSGAGDTDRIENLIYGDPLDNEGIMVQLNVIDPENTVTNLYLDGFHLRHLVTGEQAEFSDGSTNMVIDGQTGGLGKHPALDYTNLTNLTALGMGNVGGLGNGSWQLAVTARDPDTNVIATTLFELSGVNIALERDAATIPIAHDKSVATLFETPVAITLTGDDGTTFAILDAPASGTVTGAAPNVTYIPNADFYGNDSFTFTLSDGILFSTGTVSIAVSAPYVQFPGDIPDSFWEDALVSNQTFTSQAYKFGVTFDLTMEAFNIDSNLVQVGTALLNKSGGNIVVSGAGPNNAAIDFLGETNEAVKLTLSLTPGTGVSVTNLWLDMLRFAAWSKDEDGVLFISGSNTYSWAGSGNSRFNYTDDVTTITGNEVQELVGMIPLTVDNAGGVGDDSWELIIVSAISGTRSNSSFSVRDLDIFFEKTGSLVTEYELWANQYPGIGGPGDDYDGDSLDNLGEYGLGGNPTNPADKGFTETGSDGSSLEYIYAKRSSAASGISYSLQSMTNLYFPFSGPVPGLTVVGVGTIDAEFDAVTNQVPIDSDTKFLKLIIEEN